MTLSSASPQPAWRGRIAWFVVGSVLGFGLFVGGLWLYRTTIAPPPLRGVDIQSTRTAYDFALPSATSVVHLSDFRGKVVAVFFGYTFCPDVCPTTLAELNAVMDMLGPQSEDVQVLYISVDPERDTPLRANQYAQGFNSAFVGLSGTPDEITRASTAFGAVYEKVPAPDSAAGYLMQHSASVFVIDRQGRLRTMWPFGMARDDIVSDIRSLLGQ